MKTFSGNVYQLELSELTRWSGSSIAEQGLLTWAQHGANVILLLQIWTVASSCQCAACVGSG